MTSNPTRSDAVAGPTPTDLTAFAEAGTLAPSADNNQPWLFDPLASGVLRVSHDRTRGLPSDVNDMFDLLALGAAVENVCIAARRRGFDPRVRILPEGEGRHSAEPVADVHFQPGGPADPLAPYLAERVTCRKPYARRPVEGAVLRELGSELTGFPETAVHWLSARADVRRFSGLVATADRLRFEHRPFHGELFRQLRFTPEEAEATRDGLDVRTLEVPPPALLLLRAVRSWTLLRTLNWFGFSRALAIQSAILTWRAGTVGLLTVDGPTREAFLNGGRALQRIWLAATRRGLAFHPLGSLPIFQAMHQNADRLALVPSLRKSCARIAARLGEAFPYLHGRVLHLAFRLGWAARPTSRSLRRRPTGTVASDRPLTLPLADLSLQ